LINNGGGIDRSPILISKPENAISCIQEHLFSSIRLVHALVPIFRKNKKGKIVHICSTAATLPWVGSLGYTVAKSAMLGLSRSLVNELAKYGITSNCLLPGLIETPSTEGVFRIAGKSEIVAMQSLGNADIIANAVHFLIDDQNKHINGAEIVIDGGFQYHRTNPK
jgi:NAD(P)-dependent dehydrogenase (short-subunit alcohol dehydrogenase family)